MFTSVLFLFSVFYFCLIALYTFSQLSLSLSLAIYPVRSFTFSFCAHHVRLHQHGRRLAMTSNRGTRAAVCRHTTTTTATSLARNKSSSQAGVSHFVRAPFSIIQRSSTYIGYILYFTIYISIIYMYSRFFLLPFSKLHCHLCYSGAVAA